MLRSVWNLQELKPISPVCLPESIAGVSTSMEISQTEQPAPGTCTIHFKIIPPQRFVKLTVKTTCISSQSSNKSKPFWFFSFCQPLGDLGTLEADQNGEAFYSGKKEKLKVADLIGRAVVVYKTEDKKSVPGLTAAVIARSAGVGENYKKLCTCDGTVIWEATDSDFVTSKG